MFKTCLIAFGNVFGHFENVKVFPASWFCSKFWHSWVHWALFFRESYLKTSSKHVWRLLGTFLDTSEISNFRFCFHFIPIFDPSEHDDFKKSPGNMFEHCWVPFWTFLKIWFFFRLFFEVFHVATLQCVLAISFRKKYLKTSSELIWTLLGSVSDTLEILKFSIFSIFRLSNLQGAVSNNFTEKISSKHVQNMFDCFWERFWAFWKCENFSSFLKLFQISTFLGALGIFFGASYLKTCSKLVWTLLGTFLDTSEISKLRFCFPFVPIFDPSEHDDFKKSPGNMFEHCWVRFWTFLKIWFFFDYFLKFFKSRPSSVY